MLWVVLLCALLLAVLRQAMSGPIGVVTITIVGATKAQETQIRAHISPLNPAASDDVEAYLSALESRAADSLQALGYYHATATTSHATYKNNTAITLDIDAGQPALIDAFNLKLSGEADDSREFRKILGTLPIRTGQPLNHGDYERAKDILYSHARNLGFFGARFIRSQVLVSRKEKTAHNPGHAKGDVLRRRAHSLRSPHTTS